MALNVGDLDRCAEGLLVRLARSKTDQEGTGATLGVPFGTTADTCPVAALDAWLEAAGIEDGPILRPVDRHGRIRASRLTGRSVARIVQRAAERAGLDPAKYAGHSLRAGFITSAAEADIGERDIMRHSRHKSIPVMRSYVREASVWRANAAGRVGL